ncbi:MAG: hypothetical protein K9I29_04070 [Bacteroidales bacterium]|nr:hypothetical protein [Bacteroidales bacterium]MCF8327448.1 hypothetical protein [Bacteroidales bacterium]
MLQIRNDLITLGKLLQAAGEYRFGHLNTVQQQYAQELEPLIELAWNENHWFTENNTRFAFLAYAQMLKELENRTDLPLEEKNETLAVVPPAIAPLDGLKDIIIALLSGYKVQVKQMLNKEKLIPGVIESLYKINPEIKNYLSFQENQISAFDRIIVTIPADKTTQWEKYFSQYPGKIRHSSYGAGIITGKETLNQLEAIGNDIFRYFGKTPENIYKLYLPKKFPVEMLNEPFEPFELEMKYHTPYFNNFEYNKSIYLINNNKNTDNGYVIFKEDPALESRIAVIHTERYNDQKELKQLINRDKDNLTHIVSVQEQDDITTVEPGNAVKPSFSDPDSIDTFNKINS